MSSLKVYILRYLAVMKLQMDKEARELLEHCIQDMPDPMRQMTDLLATISASVVSYADLRQIILQNQPAADFDIAQFTEVVNFGDSEVLLPKGSHWELQPRKAFNLVAYYYNYLAYVYSQQNYIASISKVFQQALQERLGFDQSYPSYHKIESALYNPISVSAALNQEGELTACLAIYKNNALTDGFSSINMRVKINLFQSQSYLYDECICIVVGTVCKKIFAAIAVSPPLRSLKHHKDLLKRNSTIAIPVQADPYLLIIKGITSYSLFLKYQGLFKELPRLPSHVILMDWNFSLGAATDLQMPHGTQRALYSAYLLRDSTPHDVGLILINLWETTAVPQRCFPSKANAYFRGILDKRIILADDPFVLEYGRSRILISNYYCIYQLRCASANEYLKLKPIFGTIQQPKPDCPFPEDLGVEDDKRNIIVEHFLQTIFTYQTVAPMPFEYFRPLAEIQTSFDYDALVIGYDDLYQYSCRIEERKCIVMGQFAKGMYCCLGGCQGIVRGGVFQ